MESRALSQAPSSATWKPGISVLVVEHSRMACQLMAVALRRRHRIGSVILTTNASEGISYLNKQPIDVALISAHLPDGPAAGIVLAQQVHDSHLKSKVIVLVDSIEPAIVVESFRTGAAGIFSREEPFELMCKCVQAVHDGQIWGNNKAMRFAVSALANAPVPETQFRFSGHSPLTERERSIVQLLTEGRTNRDISQQLKLSEHTVRNYLFRIFNKVGASSRLELALFATSEFSPTAGVAHPSTP